MFLIFWQIQSRSLLIFIHKTNIKKGGKIGCALVKSWRQNENKGYAGALSSINTLSNPVFSFNFYVFCLVEETGF